MPTPKQTRHSVDRCFVVVAWRIIRKIDDARGTPKDSGRFVTKMKIVPLHFSVYAFADSDADVDDAGYSPPVLKPVMPALPSSSRTYLRWWCHGLQQIRSDQG